MDQYADVRFHVPPECQGQIVEAAYGLLDDGETVIMRLTDRSMPIGHPERVTYTDLGELPEDEEFEPWNYEPSVGGE